MLLLVLEDLCISLDVFELGNHGLLPADALQGRGYLIDHRLLSEGLGVVLQVVVIGGVVAVLGVELVAKLWRTFLEGLGEPGEYLLLILGVLLEVFTVSHRASATVDLVHSWLVNGCFLGDSIHLVWSWLIPLILSTEMLNSMPARGVFEANGVDPAGMEVATDQALALTTAIQVRIIKI